MRRYQLYIEDILKSIDKINRYINGMSKNEFVANELVVDAVLRNLEIIGEAAGKIPDDVKENYPDISWRKMIGLRNIVIHEYFGVDLDIIWKIITANLPEEREKIAAIYS